VRTRQRARCCGGWIWSRWRRGRSGGLGGAGRRASRGHQHRAALRVVGLVAAPWEIEGRHGISFRAQRIEAAAHGSAKSAARGVRAVVSVSALSSDRVEDAVLSPDVRLLADVLGALFEHDRQLAVALKDAQRRLLDANDRLTVGLSAGALSALFGPAGPDLGLSARWPAVLDGGSPVTALEEVADAIRRAFVDYQHGAEERRQVAADVGEATVRLVDAMIASGFSEAQARRADVWALRDGTYREG
jgi:hypothetical protein